MKGLKWPLAPSPPPYQRNQVLLLLLAPPFQPFHLVVPLGLLQTVVVVVPSDLLGGVGRGRGLAEPDFGDDQAWPDAAPSHHVQRQQTGAADGHG